MKTISTKILALVLALLMLLSASAVAETAPVVSNSDVFNTDAEIPDMKLQLASIVVTEGFDYNNGNEFFAYWSDKFGVEWELISLSFDVWATQLNTWISAEDMPDWCIWNYDPVTANEWVDQELLLKWPEDWRTKYPYLSKAANACPNNAFFEEKYGGMYIFFKPLYFSNFPADFLTNSTSLVIRKDWAEQAGYDLSANDASGTMSISQVFDYCRAIKKAGILEYPLDMSASTLMTLLGYCTEGNGVITPAYTNEGADEYYWGPEKNAEEIKHYLGIIQDAYKEGLINPEFFASGDDAAFENSGKSCVMLKSADPGSINGTQMNLESYLDVDMETQCAMYVLTDDNGIFHEPIRDNFWTCNILSPDLTAEEVDRILSIWDYCCRDEVQIEMHMGFEGTDWAYNAEGLPESLLADTEYGNIYTKYTTLYPLYNMVALQGDDFMFIDASLSKYSRDLAGELFKIRAGVSSARNKVTDYDLLGYTSPRAATAGIVYATEYAGLITMDGDLSANYDNFIAENSGKANLIVKDMNEEKASKAQ